LAGAIAARQCGFTVTLADHSQAPIDKACGEGIMPEGVAALAARPDTFTRLLAVGNGMLSLRSVGLRSLAAFILQLLRAGKVD
jgi:hypothetical protein